MSQIRINKSTLAAFTIALVGAVAAALLMPVSRDYLNYIDMFNESANSPNIFQAVQTIELTYSITAYLTKNIFVTSLILGLIALNVKINFFAKYKDVTFIAVAYYFARFFLVHDVTQVRISFAIAMLIIAYLRLQKAEFFYGFCFLIIAVLSHTSTLVYLPIIYIAATIKKPEAFLKKAVRVIVILVPIFVICATLILSQIPIADIIANLPDARLGNYYSEDYNVAVPNLFTDVFFYLKVAALLTLILSPLNSENKVRDARFGIVFLFSLAFFVLFHGIYAIASRLADIAAPFECVVVALFIKRLSIPNKVRISPFGSFLLRSLITIVIIARLVMAQLYLFK